MWIDGKKIAAQIETHLAKEIRRHKAKPNLAVVLVGDDLASRVYVRKKAGAQYDKRKTSPDVTLRLARLVFPLIFYGWRWLGEEGVGKGIQLINDAPESFGSISAAHNRHHFSLAFTENDDSVGEAVAAVAWKPVSLSKGGEVFLLDEFQEISYLLGFNSSSHRRATIAGCQVPTLYETIVIDEPYLTDPRETTAPLVVDNQDRLRGSLGLVFKIAEPVSQQSGEEQQTN